MSVKPTTTNRRADLTRKAILRAAIREFSQHGLAGARTEAIAESAKVNKASTTTSKAKAVYTRRPLKRSPASPRSVRSLPLIPNTARGAACCAPL
jgi:hypothetical protein